MHWPEHRGTCALGRPNDLPETTERLLDGARKFGCHYHSYIASFASQGMQGARGWWRGPGRETDEVFLGRLKSASRRVEWQILIREKSTSDPVALLHHQDFQYVEGSGCFVNLDGIGSTEVRE